MKQVGAPSNGQQWLALAMAVFPGKAPQQWPAVFNIGHGCLTSTVKVDVIQTACAQRKTYHDTKASVSWHVGVGTAFVSHPPYPLAIIPPGQGEVALLVPRSAVRLCAARGLQCFAPVEL